MKHLKYAGQQIDDYRALGITYAKKRMNAIIIQKIGITDLAVDAIVNSANDGLWADGGVSGTIFRSARRDLLQAACNEIEHCDTEATVEMTGSNMKEGDRKSWHSKSSRKCQL